MKTSHTVLALSFVSLVVPHVSEATADTRRPRVCRLVLDESGDATGGPLYAGLNPNGNVAAYDIISADIASNGSTMTAVIRVNDLEKYSESAPTGIHWRLDFSIRGSLTPIYLQAYATPFGDGFDLGYVDGTTSNSFTGVNVRGVFDFARDEVRISAPMGATADEAIIVRGSVFEGIHASAGRFWNTAGRHPSVSERTDEASTGRSYTAGAPSCVTVGE